jgi:hypothetical protein
MGRKTSSTSTARIVPDNHRCKPDDGSRMQCDPQRCWRTTKCDHTQVVDDFPAIIPVTPRELDVLETYLGSLLNDILSDLH